MPHQALTRSSSEPVFSPLFCLSKRKTAPRPSETVISPFSARDGAGSFHPSTLHTPLYPFLCEPWPRRVLLTIPSHSPIDAATAPQVGPPQSILHRRRWQCAAESFSLLPIPRDPRHRQQASYRLLLTNTNPRSATKSFCRAL